GSAVLASSTAVRLIPTSPGGMHRIPATYNGGDGIFAPSTSGPPVIWPVLPAATTTALASSDTAAPFGQPVIFTATVGVVAPGTTAAAPPAGTVTFLDGVTVLGTGTLSTSNGVTTATFRTSSLAPGTHHVTAAYGGDANYPATTPPPALAAPAT